jgi:hypothetical protein
MFVDHPGGGLANNSAPMASWMSALISTVPSAQTTVCGVGVMVGVMVGVAVSAVSMVCVRVTDGVETWKKGSGVFVTVGEGVLVTVGV